MTTSSSWALSAAIHIAAAISLPVVDPDDRGRLVGILSRSDILHAYPTDPAPVEDGELERLG